jgi:hypothetical protein
MTDEEREKLIDKMVVAVSTHIPSDNVQSGDVFDAAIDSLAIAEEAISKDYCARIAELEAALKPFADKANVFHDYVDDYPIMFGAEPPLRVVHLRAARAALRGERG